MLAFQLSEADGEMLIIGLVAIIAAMTYHKLDQMMKLQERTNELLAKLAPGEKPADPGKSA
jgi:preprotein translocase subunit YajC